MAPAALMVAATVASAGGQIYSGMQASGQAKSQAAMSEYNAQLKEREAQQIEAQTALQQRRQAEASSRQQSTMLANMGASGVVASAGTPLLVQAKQAEESETENLLIGYEGRDKATTSRYEASLYKAEAKNYKKQAKSAKISSYIGAGTTLLTGFSTASSLGGTNTWKSNLGGTNTGFGRSSSAMNFYQP